MNNRYLYRAKRTDNGEWVEGNVVLSNDADEEYKSIIIPAVNSNMFTQDNGNEDLGFENWHKVDPSTICQYTGLTDKNGKLIWENDVVKCNYNNYGEKGAYVGKVIFREDNCIFVVTNGKSTDYEWWNEEKEVIGNIFDNADLLGE